MAGADMHHRTGEFIEVYRSVIAGLRYFMGTENGIAPVRRFRHRRDGGCGLQSVFRGRQGDRLYGGEIRRALLRIAQAFGLDTVVIEKPYGESVKPEQVAQALAGNAGVQGVFIQATESSTGVSHDVEAIGKIVAATDAILVVDAITGLGTSVLEIDAWGLDVVIGGSQKAVMIPPGLAYCSVSEKALQRAAAASNPYFYFDLRKHIAAGVEGDSPWTPAASLILGLGEVLRFVREIGREKLIANAQLLSRAARGAAQALGLELFVRDAIPAGARYRDPPARGNRLRRDRQALQERFRSDRRQQDRVR